MFSDLFRLSPNPTQPNKRGGGNAHDSSKQHWPSWIVPVAALMHTCSTLMCGSLRREAGICLRAAAPTEWLASATAETAQQQQSRTKRNWTKTLSLTLEDNGVKTETQRQRERDHATVHTSNMPGEDPQSAADGFQ